MDPPKHPEYLQLGDKEEKREGGYELRGGREELDQICEASRGTLSGWPTHVAPGQVGACVKSLQALFGGFQSHPSGWVSLDPSLLETEPKAVIF